MLAKSQPGPAVEGIVPPLASVCGLLSLADRRTYRRARNRVERQGVKKHEGLYRKVLIFGKHRELTLYRAAVLNYSGFDAVIPRNRQDAIDAIREGNFDAAILSYTLSADTVEELAELVRQHHPHCPLISISQERTRDPRINPDAIVLAEDGPPALISALQRVLQHGMQ